jgi:hypothetical protein
MVTCAVSWIKYYLVNMLHRIGTALNLCTCYLILINRTNHVTFTDDISHLCICHKVQVVKIML